MTGHSAQDLPAPLRGARLVVGAMTLAAANFMVILDTTIANVSVPTIAGALGTTPSEGTWVVTSYAVAEAITMPLTGWLASRFGTLRLMVGSMVAFTICSVLCGLAPTFEALVAARVLQGVAGAPMIPLAQTLLRAIFPPERQAQGLAIFSMTAIAGPALGPILGGWISDNLGWSWIFFINVPVACLAAAASVSVLATFETPTRRRPMDWVGLALLVVWVGALQLVLDTGQHEEWFESSTIVTLTAVSVVVFGLFVAWELTDRAPAVDLRVFADRSFAVGATVLALGYGTFFGSVVVMPLWLQLNLGYTATDAGLATAFTGLTAVVMSQVAARLMTRIDLRLLVVFGMGMIALSNLLRAGLTTDADFWTIAAFQSVQGLGMPFFFVPLTQIALGTLAPPLIPTAAGLMNFMRTSCAAFGASVMTSFWYMEAAGHRTDLVGHVRESDPAVAEAWATLSAQLGGAEPGRAALSRLVDREALTLAADEVFFVSALLVLSFLPLLLLVRAPRR